MHAQVSSYRDRLNAVLGDAQAHREYLGGSVCASGMMVVRCILAIKTKMKRVWIGSFHRRSVTVAMLLFLCPYRPEPRS